MKAEDLVVSFTVNFSSNEDMYKSFYDYWDHEESPWTFDKETCTATFEF